MPTERRARLGNLGPRELGGVKLRAREQTGSKEEGQSSAPCGQGYQRYK